MAKRRWHAILAGLLLLVAAPVLERANQVSAQTDTVSADDVLRDWTIDKLTHLNSRLPQEIRTRIADSVLRCTHEQALPADLVLAVLTVESRARPHAYSPKGAIGLMQVMPYMYKALALPGSAGHLEANIEAGCLLLADNIRRLGEEDGVSAYFWGSSIRGDGYLRKIVRAREELGSLPRVS